MSVTPLDAPRPLPAVPCPVFDGRPIRWEPWSAAMPITHIDPSCQACAFPGPLSTAWGIRLPLDGETWRTFVAHRLPSGRRVLRDGTVKAWPVHALWAVMCPSCFHLDVSNPHGGDHPQVLLCDGCDALCAIGANEVEARHTLTTVYNGWSADGADWDLCQHCNPAATPTAPPRALAAFREARKRSTRKGKP